MSVKRRVKLKIKAALEIKNYKDKTTLTGAEIVS